MRNIIILFLLSFSFSAWSQFDCGTEEPENFQPIDRNILLEEIENIEHSILRTPRIFMISFHIIRNTNGSNGMSPTKVQGILDDLNKHYIDADVQFESCGIHFIDNTDYMTCNYNKAKTIAETYNSPNVIDMYFVPKLFSNDGGSLCGFASFPKPNNSYPKIFMNNSCVSNGSTISHEMGHYFGLKHTHSTSSGKEYVARINCETAGDGFCDTPADPKLSTSTVNSNCKYIGFERDDHGDLYRPDPTNLMSYSRKKCRFFFSNEQLATISLVSKGLNSHYLSDCNIPDLAISTSEKSNSILFKSFEPLKLKVYLDNFGIGTNENVKLIVYLRSSSPSYKETVIFEKKYSFLDPNIQIIEELEIPVNELTANATKLYFWIDSEEKVEEFNESNNKKTYQITFDIENKDEISIFPNPAHDFVNIFTKNRRFGDLDVIIYSSDGKIVSKQIMNKQNRYNLKQLDISNLSPGVYYIKIQVDEKDRLVGTFVKI